MIARSPEFEWVARCAGDIARFARHELMVRNHSTALGVYVIDDVGKLRALG